LLNHPP